MILTGHIGVRSLFSYISGYLGDQYDKRIIIAVGFLISSLMLASFVFVENIIGTVVVLFFMAIGMATFHPLATALAGENAVARHRAFHLGFFESTGALGIILATLFFGLLVENWGWRYTSLLLALPGFPIACVYLKSKKEKINYKAIAENNVDKFYILIFIIARGVRALGIGAIFSFLPTFATDQLAVSAGRASWLMAIMFIGNIFGALIGGWYSDKSSPMLIIIFSTITVIPVIWGMTISRHLGLVVIFIFFVGLTNGGYYTPQNCWLTTVSTQKIRGKVMGFAFLIDGVSATIAPTIFGWIADITNIAISFRWAVLPIAVSFLFFIRLYYLQKNDRLKCKVKM